MGFNRCEQFAFDKGYRVVGGHVLSPNNKKMSMYLKHRGCISYPAFRLYVSGNISISGVPKRYDVLVHRLVAYQKYGNAIYDDGICVRHLDGDPLDFSDDNIEIGTHSQNMMDIPEAIRQRSAKTAASYKRKFSDNDIRDIRLLKANGTTLKYLCEMYNVSKSTMSYIINKKTYSDVL